MSSITISNETSVDIGSSGLSCNFYQFSSFEVSLASESGVYYPAGNYNPRLFQTNVFYVSGTVAEAGSLVSLTPDGNIPAELNGTALSAEAVILTPEIFLSESALSDLDPPLPPIPQAPPPDDGKVTDHTNVILLLHGDTNPLEDSSTFNRTLLVSGDAAHTPLRKAFGSGSINFPVNTTNNGVYTEIADNDLFTLDDEAITFEARIRLDSLTEKEHTLFSFGLGSDIFMSLTLEITASGDQVVFDWKESSTVSQQVIVPLLEGKLKDKPLDFQQFAFVYSRVQGHFGVFLDGERIGLLEVDENVDPVWGGLIVAPKTVDVDFNLSVGVLDPLDSDNSKQFSGHMDEVRLTLREALYQTISPTASVYSFAWPNPIGN